jgi:hypothetical protein
MTDREHSPAFAALPLRAGRVLAAIERAIRQPQQRDLI